MFTTILGILIICVLYNHHVLQKQIELKLRLFDVYQFCLDIATDYR